MLAGCTIISHESLPSWHSSLPSLEETEIFYTTFFGDATDICDSDMAAEGEAYPFDDEPYLPFFDGSGSEGEYDHMVLDTADGEAYPFDDQPEMLSLAADGLFYSCSDTLRELLPHDCDECDPVSCAQLSDDEPLADEPIPGITEINLALRRHHNAVVPIARLPTELLDEVFMLCAHTHDFAAWPPFSQVCHRWRTLALRRAALWTRIDVRRPRMAAELARRARTLPLALRADFHHCWPTHDDVAAQLASVAAALGDAPVCALDLAVSPALFAGALAGMLARPAPGLRALRLALDEGPRPMELHFHGVAPALCDLQTAGFGVPWHSPLLRNLTTLAVHRCPRALRPRWAELLASLADMPALHLLELDDALPTEAAGAVSGQRIPLPNIRTVSITDDVVAAAAFLERVALPRDAALALASLHTSFSATRTQRLSALALACLHTADPPLPAVRLRLTLGRCTTMLRAWPAAAPAEGASPALCVTYGGGREHLSDIMASLADPTHALSASIESLSIDGDGACAEPGAASASNSASDSDSDADADADGCGTFSVDEWLDTFGGFDALPAAHTVCGAGGGALALVQALELDAGCVQHAAKLFLPALRTLVLRRVPFRATVPAYLAPERAEPFADLLCAALARRRALGVPVQEVQFLECTDVDVSRVARYVGKVF